MKFLSIITIGLLVLACESRNEVDPHIAVLNSYNGKTIKNIQKSNYNKVVIYFTDGDSLKFTCYKYAIGINKKPWDF